MGEAVPEVLSTSRDRRPRAILRPRAQFLQILTDPGRWITFLYFFFTLQPMRVEVGRVHVDEACDRLQTKTKHFNMIFS